MIPQLLTKLDKNTSEFISLLVTKSDQKSKLVSISLAKALSDKLPLPISTVECIDIHFSANYKVQTSETIAIINELIPLNKEEVLDYAKRFYKFRYNQVYITSIVPYINKDTAVEDFFGISKVFSEDFIVTVKEQNSIITSYINRFNDLLCKLA
jgi:hypothetical protein